MFSRRHLLKAIGLATVAASLGFDQSPVWARITGAADYAPGELYSGFLLLPNGEAVPPFVKPPEYGIPIVCSAGNTPPSIAPQYDPVSEQFTMHQDVRRFSRLPLYGIDASGHGLTEDGGFVLGYRWGDIALAVLSYKTATAPLAADGSAVTLWASTQYPMPYPFWFDPAVSLPDAIGQPEKVALLPSPGLQVSSGYGLAHQRLGYTFHWIQRNVLYWLVVENYASREYAQSVASSLGLMA